MAFKNLEAMYSELNNQNVIAWKLLDAKGNIISDYQGEKSDIVIQRLKEVLDGQNDDLFAIEYKNNLAPAAKAFRNTFRNRDATDTTQTVTTSTQIAGTSKEDMQAAIDAALEAYKKEVTVAGIIEKNKELEKQLKEATPSKFESTIIKIGEVVLPILENYTNKASVGKVPKKAPTKNPTDPNLEGENKEETGLNKDEETLANNLSAMVEKIVEAGLDPIEITEKLANLSTDKLNTAIKFL